MSSRPTDREKQQKGAGIATSIGKIEVLFRRAQASQAKGQSDDAIKALDQVLGIATQNAHALRSKCGILVDLKRFERLRFDLGRYDPSKITDASFAYSIGLEYYNLTRYDKALQFLLRAIELNPAHVGARLLVADTYAEVGKAAKSLDILSGVTASGIRTSDDSIFYAKALIKLARYDDALLVLDRLRRDEKTTTHALHQIVRLPHMYWPNELDAEISDQLASARSSPDHQRQLHFTAGRIADQHGEYDTAFSHFKQANRLSAGAFDPEHVRKSVSTLIKVFGKNFNFSPVDPVVHDVTPVFIVGLPRAGKTLLESLLGRHHEIAKAKERTLRLFIEGDFFVGPSGQAPHGLEAGLRRLSATQRKHFADSYLDAVLSSLLLDRPARFVTNTLPINFWNAGVIRVIFPKAKIINVTRHPLDLGLACFMTDFRKEYSFASDLGWLGAYYQAYQAICSLWRNLLEDQWLDVSYETLVSDPGATVNAVLSFLDADQTVSGMSNTGSYEVSEAHVGHWRNYERHLSPLVDMLESPESRQ